MTTKPTSRKPLDRVPALLQITCQDASVHLEAAEPAEEGKPKLRRFTMTAYTGGAMTLEGWQHPVVVDLAGLRVSRRSRPILKDHNRSEIVGHTDQIEVSENRLEVAGVISGAGATAQEVIATSENGFPWQASLGGAANKVVFIAAGKTAQANGREFTGPLYIARKSTLGEISFVALGADDDTTAQVAATANKEAQLEVTDMEFEQWSAEQGFQLDALDAANTLVVKTMFEKERDRLTAASKVETPVTVEAAEDPVATMRTAAAAESKRIAALTKICRGDRHGGSLSAARPVASADASHATGVFAIERITRRKL